MAKCIHWKWRPGSAFMTLMEGKITEEGEQSEWKTSEKGQEEFQWLAIMHGNSIVLT